MTGAWQKLARISPKSADTAAWLPPAPQEPFFAIGDVHGCAGLLRRLLNQIDQIDPVAPVICVGDMIDRGEASGEVLRMLFTATTAADARVICLRGNHEDMLLNTLADPVAHAPLWLSNGGLQTVTSMGIGDVSGSMSPSDLFTMADRIRDWLGPLMLAWLADLPMIWRSGTVWVVHAGVDPEIAMPKQNTGHLLWGHPRWPRHRRIDAQWVLHGHVVVKRPFCADGEIAIDTGAYGTGILTAAHVTGDGVTFLTAEDRKSRGPKPQRGLS